MEEQSVSIGPLLCDSGPSHRRDYSIDEPLPGSLSRAVTTSRPFEG